MLNLPGWITCCLLAQEKETPAPPGFVQYMPAFFIVILMYLYFTISGDKKKQKAHRQALEAIKKNDRVVTIGGIYGVVTNVQRETDEVTIKVDEATNTKLRVTLSAIARVVADESAAADKSTKSSS